MFENFDEDARRVVARAHGRAVEMGHAHIGTLHLLLGLADLKSGPTRRAFENLGLDPERLRAVAERLEPPQARPDAARQILFLPRARRMIEIAQRLAREAGGGPAGPEHLLRALLDLPEATAIRALEALGLDAQLLRRDLAARSGQGPGSTPR